MSKDSDDTKFDPKVHTLEKLHEIVEDVYMEYATSYVFYYNMILNLKEQGSLSPDNLENIKNQMQSFTKTKGELVCKKYNITPVLLDKWVYKYQHDR